MPRVEQGRMLKPMRRFFSGFLTRYRLRPYDNADAPAVFFGAYDGQLGAIRDHRGPAIIVWLGGDAANMRRPLWRRRAKRCRHVAVGPWLERDLVAAGLPYKRINLCGSPLLEQLAPTPRGRAVYAYVPAKRDTFFGGPLVRRVRDAMPHVEFIIRTDHDMPQADMPALYARCGVGLRLTRHDGGSETVIEMGLMGRRTVFNGDVPCAIPWFRHEEIAKLLREELAGAGPSVDIVAAATRRHVEWGDWWLDTEEWDG